MLRSLLCLLVVVLCTSYVRAADPPAAVADLLSKLQAETIPAGQQICAELIKLGPDAIRSIVNMLIPPGEGNDTAARFALNGLSYYVARPGAEAERSMFTGILIDGLEKADSPLIKTFLMNRLQVCAQNEAVAPLSKYLADPDLCEPAAQALERIGTPAAIAAMSKAIPTAGETCRRTLIRALGTLRAVSAAGIILPYSTSDDAMTRRLALFALANIGAPSAADILATAAESSNHADRAEGAALYLLWARRQDEEGKQDRCVEICRNLIRTHAAEPNVVANALSTLVTALGTSAQPDLYAAILSDNKEIRAAALKLLEPMQGEAISGRLVERLAQGSPPVRAEIINSLGRRHDDSALPTLLAAIKDENKIVRLAAIPAAARFHTPEVVTSLLAGISTDQADEIKLIQEALTRMPGERALAAVAAAIPGAPPQSRIALIQVLASRRARPQMDALFAATKDSDAAVRLAAIKAIGTVAEPSAAPRIIELLVSSSDEREQAELQRALVAVCKRNRDAQTRAEPLLAVLDNAPAQARKPLLKSLSELGGEKALGAVLKNTRSSDEATRGAAVRALADWPDASAADELLSIARSSDNATHQVLALRGYLRLLALPSDRPESRTLAMYKDALSAAKRPDEKRQALAGISRIRSIDALNLVAPYLENDDLQAEAITAAMKIIQPRKEGTEPLRGPEVNKILEKIVAQTKDEKVKALAGEYLKR